MQSVNANLRPGLLRAVGLAAVLTLCACSAEPEPADAEDGPGSAPQHSAAAEPADDAGPDSGADGSGSGGTNTDGRALPSIDNLPSCGELHAALGPAVADLVAHPDDPDPDPTSDAVRYTKQCTYFPPAIVDGSADFEQLMTDGGYSVSIEVAREDDEAEMREFDLVADEPRLAEHDGYIATLGNEWVGGEQIDPFGYHFGRFNVMHVATSLYLQDPDNTAQLTNDWALEASIRLYEEFSG